MLVPLAQSLTPVSSPPAAETTFAPNNVTSATLAGWWKGDAGTFQDSARTIPANVGDPLGGWADQSGNGHHASQATSANKMAVGTVNGLNAILANGTQLFASGTGLSLTAPYTILVVGIDNGAQGFSQIVGGSSSILDFLRSDGQVCSVSGHTVSSRQLAANVVHVGVLRVPSSGGATWVVDGLDETTTTGLTGNWTSLLFGQSANRAINLYVCEVAAYTGIVSDYELAKLGATTSGFYFNRWGRDSWVTGDKMTGYVDFTQPPYSGNLQAGVNALTAGLTGWLGSNTFTLTQPLLMLTPTTSIVGAGKYAASITTNGFYGPVVVVAQKNTAPTLVSSLLTGTGSALTLPSGSSGSYYNLRDINTLSLDGTVAFCLEFAFQPSSVADGVRGIVQSQGVRTSADSRTTSFDIHQGSSGALVGVMTIGSTKYTLTSSNNFLVNGTAAYCALTYDGTTIRLFGGPPGGTCALLASQAATGTVSQAYTEDVTVGGVINTWPESLGNTIASAAGTIDGIRVSNTARYTSAFTAPSAKITATDSNTLILLNFDVFLSDTGATTSSAGIVAKCYVGASGVGWLVWRLASAVGGNYRIERCSVGGANSGYGIFCQNAFINTYRHLSVTSANGICLADNCFESIFEDVVLTMTSGTTPSGKALGRFGLAMIRSSGGRVIRDVTFAGFPYGLVCVLAAGHIDTPIFNAGTHAVAYMLLTSDGSTSNDVQLDTFLVDDEGVTSGELVAGMILTNLNTFVMTGGKAEFLSNTSAVYAAIINGGSTYLFNGVVLHSSTGPGLVTAFTHQASAPTACVNNNCVLGGVAFSG